MACLQSWLCSSNYVSTYSQVQGGSLLIDSSTIAPDEARQLASLSEQKAVEFIDAPVSGGMCVC